MDVTEEEDEVVEELDVFLSKELSDKLYVLQYPTTHVKRGYSSDQRLVARIKPQHKKLEMDVILDTSSPNYDQSKGEQIAVNVDGGASGDGLTYENSIMDYQVLSSCTVPQIGKRFAAAVMHDGQLHLTPIAQIMQMQPNFKYLDHAEKRAAHVAKMKAQAESGNSSQDELDDAKAVTIRFKGAENDTTRVVQEQSYASYEKRLFQEKWIPATFHYKDEAQSEKERNRLFCSQAFNSFDDSSSNPEVEIKPSDYLETLLPRYAVSDDDSGTSPENVLSIGKLKRLSLGDQLKLLMKSAKIMHFSHLITLLPSNPDANSVVRSLQSYAVLVKGCWIVKSEVLYPADTVTPISGTPSDFMCKARDFILCLFTKQDFLVRSQVTKQVNIPWEEVKVILEQIAKMKVGSGWSLKLPVDEEFISRYSEVYERQNMVWASRYKQLSKRFSNADSHEKSTKKTNSSTAHSNKKSGFKSPPRTSGSSPGRARRKSGSRKNSVSEKAEMTEKELNGLRNFLSPPRPDAENDTGVIVEHAVADVDTPYSFQLNGDDVSKSFTSLLHDAEPAAAPMPFVKPSAVGISTEFRSTPMEVDSPGLCSNDTSINMESVNATVALVEQAIHSNDVFNGSEPST